MNFDSVCVHIYYKKATEQWATLADVSVKLLKEWANLNGYDFKAFEGRKYPRHTFAWDKIAILKEATIKNTHEWHIIFDADIFITNLSKSLNEILEGRIFSKVYTGYDWKYPINAGVLLAHSSSYSLWKNIERLIGACPEGLFEQGCLQVIRDLSEEWHRNITPLPHNNFNSYSPQKGWGGSWQNGDLLVHFAGWKPHMILDLYKCVFNNWQQKSAIELSESFRQRILKIRKDIS